MGRVSRSGDGFLDWSLWEVLSCGLVSAVWMIAEMLKWKGLELQESSSET
jgi:hypothetical protein